ncbi:SecDF P1 head subdomain-containing protein [Histidinibacterium lentulum]|nr:hypothetical protein [Histidinibacterium lentulum]
MLAPLGAVAEEGCLRVALAGAEAAAPALAARAEALGGHAEGLVAVVPDGVVRDAGAELLTRPGHLSFHAMIGRNGEIDPEGALIRDAGVRAAEVRSGAGGTELYLALDEAASERLARVTADLLGGTVAMALDGEVVVAPRVLEPITGGELVISGGFTGAELERMAVMMAAPLPGPLVIETVERTGCTAPGATEN